VDEDKFEQSTAVGGAHHLLAQLVGEWEGVTRTWFDPGELADESSTRGTIRAILDGRFVVHEYEGTVGGKPMRGVATYGYHLQTETLESSWVDSFHMGTGIMFSQGVRTDNGFSVLGSYGDPSGGSPWGWRTEIKLGDPDHLTITAYNITPLGQEAKAVETVYTRKR
jgi:hypothetical protein